MLPWLILASRASRMRGNQNFERNGPVCKTELFSKHGHPGRAQNSLRGRPGLP